MLGSYTAGYIPTDIVSFKNGLVVPFETVFNPFQKQTRTRMYVDDAIKREIFSLLIFLHHPPESCLVGLQ